MANIRNRGGASLSSPADVERASLFGALRISHAASAKPTSRCEVRSATVKDCALIVLRVQQPRRAATDDDGRYSYATALQPQCPLASFSVSGNISGNGGTSK